eukprot:GHRR01028036.1.p1 GENE.GHRR01028036.1~~GHRR01028036.1.p1  ORF type:complete len:835 (+),score=219.07 GHRR01028036.1:164-2668(+)
MLIAYWSSPACNLMHIIRLQLHPCPAANSPAAVLLLSILLLLPGVRIDAEQLSRSRMSYYTGLCIVPAGTIVPAAETDTTPITGYPAGSWINYVSWSPDGKHITFTTRSPGGPGDPPRGPLQLWVADATTGRARPLLGSRRLNTVFDSYSWMDDNTLVAAVLPQDLDQPPTKPQVPPGPKIQDNSSGKKSQNRTWTDLLKDEHDGDMFEYYGTAELVMVDVRDQDSEGTIIAPPRMYTEMDGSPDGQFMLVSWLTRPFSLAVPAGRFPVTVQVWDRRGSLVHHIASLPLAEDIPIAFNSCRTGPRAVSWRDDKPAELSWIEAQDGGDPEVSVSPRDVVYTLDAAAAAAASSNGSSQVAPQVLATTDLRCGGVSWCDGDLALLYESWWKTRRSIVYTFAPGKPQQEKQVLFDRSYEDVYSDPGSPLSRRTSNGSYILAKIDGQRQLLMVGQGASPEGNRPFLDLLNLDTKETRRLWQSSPPYLEGVGSIMSDNNDDAPITLDGLKLLLSRESAHEPPQTYMVSFNGPEAENVTEQKLTNFPHPYPQLKDMQKEVLRYKRTDGVDLTGTLYLPPGYNAQHDGPLPTILWAYPREYKSKEAAGQMRRSPHQFSGIGSLSPTLWLARGYAVLDGPTFPIVAEGDEEPNDTYVEQLTASAEAAVKELVAKGVTDPARVSVGGHSYGAFMAANLLAHCPQLFAAAIARSGAYNRTLTPFGFQSEERTLWQAPETYSKMSPFMMADRFSKPLLLIHGEEDNNTGTFPLQSERFFQALKGHGAPARLVLLPHEGHGYRARESVLHTLYEQDQWLEKYAGHGRTDPDYITNDNADEQGSSTSE